MDTNPPPNATTSSTPLPVALVQKVRLLKYHYLIEQDGANFAIKLGFYNLRLKDE